MEARVRSYYMITHDNFESFLEELQKEAENQAKLSQSRMLPAQLDWLTSLVGRYSWQTITVMSFLTAAAIHFLKYI